MKILIVYNSKGMDLRILHFKNTLELFHEVHEGTNISDIDKNNYDIVILDYFSNNTNDIHTELCTRMNSWKDELLRFKGKLVFYSLDDGQAIYTNKLYPEIVERIDGWIVYMINEMFLNTTPDEYKDVIRNKLITIPRYSLTYIDGSNVEYDNKINKIVFIGRTTGNYWFNNKNWRVEALKKIYNNKKLNSNFDGWLVDDTILDVDTQYPEYNKTFKFVKKNNFLSEPEWENKLRNHTLSLCIPGHTKLGYRHFQSMALKSAMVGTFDLEKDPYPYLFSDKLKNISYNVKEDLSDFEEVCEESLINTKKTKEIALYSHEIYKKYFELTPSNTYKPWIWDLIKSKFNELNIDI